MSRQPLESLLRVLEGLPRTRPLPDHRPFLQLIRPLVDSPWWRRLDAVKITGSNGKGSVAALTAAILSAAGVRTGLYTSPHVMRFDERVAVDGRPVNDRQLQAATGWLSKRLDGRRSATYDILQFEAVTAWALEAFASAEVETVVLEAGIGGRDDVTRNVPGRSHGLVSADAEHLSLLGGSLRSVVRNKVDLASAGDTLMLGDLEPQWVDEAMDYGRRRGIEVVDMWPGVTLHEVVLAHDHTCFDITVDGLRYGGLRSSLVGRHQVLNSALAIRLARHWLARHRPDVIGDGAFPELVGDAVGRLRLPGRLQRVSDDPVVVVDTAHSPAALSALASALPYVLEHRPWVWVVGISADKDPAQLMPPLLQADGVVHAVVCRAAQRGGAVERVVRQIRQSVPGITWEVATSVPDAVMRAQTVARRDGLGIVVAGGLFLASEALRVLVPESPDLRYY